MNYKYSYLDGHLMIDRVTLQLLNCREHRAEKIIWPICTGCNSLIYVKCCTHWQQLELGEWTVFVLECRRYFSIL